MKMNSVKTDLYGLVGGGGGILVTLWVGEISVKDELSRSVGGGVVISVKGDLSAVLLQDQNVKMNSVKTDLYGLVGGEGDLSHTVGGGDLGEDELSRSVGGRGGDLSEGRSQRCEGGGGDLGESVGWCRCEGGLNCFADVILFSLDVF